MNYKKIFVIIFYLFFQLTFCQNNEELKYNNAKEAYKNDDFEEANILITEVKTLYKSVPPKVAYLEILIKNKLIKADPLNDYSLLEETRRLIKSYKNKFNNIKNDNYNNIIKIEYDLYTYPKDLETFNEIKEAKRRKEQFEKEQKEKAEAEEKARKERIALEAKARQERIALEAKAREEREAIARAEMLEQERIKNEQLAIEREKNRLAQVEADRKSALEALEYSKKVERENKRRLYPFSSIGFLSGEIAKYGFIYERGGRKRVGFRFSARTSLTPEEDILTGKVIENKTEIELGPNIKILKRIYFNIGIGYGYYDRLLNNDFAGELYVEKTGYSVATTGLMIRLNNVISINGGASFMDIDKEIYKPEITFGISFNLRGKY
jgi:hypothetical protein